MTGRPYDFWLLDLDGTVVDVEQSYIYDVIAEIGDRIGHGFTDREAELLWYGVGTAREQLFAKAAVDPDRFWAVFHDVEEPVSRADATYVYDDAADFVPSLSAPVGLVTHCQSYLTEPILDRLGIRDWFDAVVCCSDETGWKPDPEPMELAMADLGVEPVDRTGAMVGDDPQDIRAGHNVGLDAVHISRPDRNWSGERVLGDDRVADLTELARDGSSRPPA